MRDMHDYVPLDERQALQARWNIRHISQIVCCFALSAGIALVASRQAFGPDGLNSSRGAVDLAGVAAMRGAKPTGTVKTHKSVHVAPHALPRRHSVVLRTAGVAPPLTADPYGRDVLQREQEELISGDRKKEGWATREGLTPQEYFAHVKTPADLAQAPPFSLKDLHASVPKRLWERDMWKSFGYLFRDVAQVAVLGVAAAKASALMPAWAAMLTVWPLYFLLQGLNMWGLFVVGHDCGHQSFSKNTKVNDLVGDIVHSSILVPYHPWRISHRKHHGNHGHVENDESWTPMAKSVYDGLDQSEKAGRFSCPVPLLAYPIYLFKGAPSKPGSHYDPNNDRLFQKHEKKLVVRSDIFNIGMVGILAASAVKFGAMAVLKYYFAPWVVYVMLLDAVTYLHHHGHHDDHPMPWYRGEEWSYLRGGLTCLDRDYGILNNLHHDIGTHVVHHLFPQMPHYNLLEATQHMKKVMGPYYRQPEPCPGPKLWGGYTNGGISLGLPTHLFRSLFHSFRTDHYVDNDGDVLFYKVPPGAANNRTSFNPLQWLQKTCTA